MARPNENWISLGPLKGQNSTDNPLALGEGWATETTNLTLEPISAVAVKRRGSALFTLPEAFTTYLARHVAIGALPQNAELWAFASAVVGPQRKVGSAAFVAAGAFPDTYSVVRTLSFNGKLFMAGQTIGGPNRLMVWDGAMIRYVGLGVSAAPTVANTGAGTYPATLRYYKVDWVYVLNSATQSRSELSDSVGFTPSGAGTAAQVTRPATLEHASHWRVWGSTDNVLFKKISGNIAVATTTYDDSVLPAAYDGDFPEPVGTFMPPPAVTRIITDGHRILMAGNGALLADPPADGETAPKSNRIWYTPVLGSLDQGDDERIPHTTDFRNWLDIGDPPTGDITELEGPMEGQIFAFSSSRPWRLVPTGDLVTPYLTYPVTSVYGAEGPQTKRTSSVAQGETENGQPALYFLDDTAGLYRITASEDVQYVSYDIQDEINALRPLMHGGSMFLFSWPEKKQTWWGLQLASPYLVSPIPEQYIYVFHWASGHLEGTRVRGGWTRWIHAYPRVASGGLQHLSVGVMHNKLPGGTNPDDLSLVPYVLQNSTARAFIFDQPTAEDGGTDYIGSLVCAPILPDAAHAKIRVTPPTVIASAVPAINLKVTAVRDFGTETRTGQISLAPEGTETRVVRTAEGLFSADVTALQIGVGDVLPTSALWQIDLATVPVSKQD